MRHFHYALTAFVVLSASAVQAAELTVATGDGGLYPQILRGQLDRFEAETGHTVTILPAPISGTETFAQFRLWLSAGNADVDVYLLSDEWVPQLADHFLDLSQAAGDAIGAHFPPLVEGQTIDGRLVGMPLFADAPALFYRAGHLGGAGGDREGDHGGRAGRGQCRHVGLRLPGQRL